MVQQNIHVRLLCENVVTGPCPGGMLLELADITTRATGAPAGYWQARLAQSAVAALLLFDARLAGVRGQLTVEEQASLLQQLVIELELDMLGCSVSSYKTKYTRPILYQHAYAVLALKTGEPPQLVAPPILPCEAAAICFTCPGDEPNPEQLGAALRGLAQGWLDRHPLPAALSQSHQQQQQQQRQKKTGAQGPGLQPLHESQQHLAASCRLAMDKDALEQQQKQKQVNPNGQNQFDHVISQQVHVVPHPAARQQPQPRAKPPPPRAAAAAAAAAAADPEPGANPQPRRLLHGRRAAGRGITPEGQGGAGGAKAHVRSGPRPGGGGCDLPTPDQHMAGADQAAAVNHGVMAPAAAAKCLAAPPHPCRQPPPSNQKPPGGAAFPMAWSPTPEPGHQGAAQPAAAAAAAAGPAAERGEQPGHLQMLFHPPVDAVVSNIPAAAAAEAGPNQAANQACKPASHQQPAPPEQQQEQPPVHTQPLEGGTGMFPELSDASPVSVVFEEKCPLFCGTLGELQLEIISGRGSGGQGAVFEARVAGYSGSNKELEDISKQQDAMQRRVAVKVLLRHSDLLPDRAVKWTPGTWCTAGQRQYGIEVQAARRCAEHDPSGHVLRVHAVGYVNVSVGADPTDIASRPALILEYAAGGSLGDLMAAQGGKLDTDPQQASASLASHKAWLAGKRMLRALRAASKAMVVHRDAKPDNMFLTVPGDVRSAKLGDLGYAMRMYEACDRGSTQVYTPGYEAPEVVENVHHGSELDVWLLGCSLLSMLTGQPPFYHSRCLPPAERAAWRHGGELVRPGSPYCDPQHPDYAQVGRYLTQAERDVLQQMLHVDPRRRPTHRKLYGTPYFMWGPTGSADYPLWELV